MLLIVRKGGSKYLLVEDHAKKLYHFPTQSTFPSQSQNDVKVTAQLMMDEVGYTYQHVINQISMLWFCHQVLCISAKLKGILKIVHRLPPPGSIAASSICVVIVAEELKSKTDLDSPKVNSCWLTKDEIYQHSNDMDKVSLGLISHLEAGVTPLPLELMETLDANGVRRISGSLDRQMLDEANYGQYGKYNNSIINYIT